MYLKNCMEKVQKKEGIVSRVTYLNVSVTLSSPTYLAQGRHNLSKTEGAA